MNAPESLTHTETRLRTATATLRRAWPHLHNPPKQPNTNTSRPKPSSRPPTNLEALNLRTQTTLTLAYWTHAIADAQHPNPISPNPIDCRDTPQMLDNLDQHARWLTGWTYTPTLINELETHAQAAKRMAWPPQKDTLVIGQCPLTPDGEHQPCGGTVRVRRNEDWAECRTCRTGAVVAWWRQRIHTPDNVTAQQLAIILAIDTGVILTEAAIRQRHKRGQLPSVGRDHKGRRLYPWKTIINSEQTGATA